MGNDQKTTLRIKRTAGMVATAMMVKNCSAATNEDVYTALKDAYFRDNLTLYRGTYKGIEMDDFLVVFSELSSTTVAAVRFAGTDRDGKGNWGASVVAVDASCQFCTK